MDLTTADPAHIDDWGSGMWKIFDELAARPRCVDQTPEGRALVLHEEAEVIDLFRRYHFHYDAGNVDAVMELFTDDCVVVNPRGTYIGPAAIRSNYEFLTGRRFFIQHFGTNHLVRFEEGMQEAWLGAFYYSIVIYGTGKAFAVGGTYLDRLRKESDGQWRIFEQRITGNYRTPVPPAELRKGNPPTPTSTRSSEDLIEPEYIL
jgi:ketosteroid isomerase-like protein